MYLNLEYFCFVLLVYINYVILVVKLICNISKEELKIVFEFFEILFSFNLLCIINNKVVVDF